MYALNTSTRSITALTTSSVSTVQPQVVCTYYDVLRQTKTDFSEYLRTPQLTTMAGVTSVAIVSAPNQGVTRMVEKISIYHGDASTLPIKVRYTDGTTSYTLVQWTVSTGQTLETFNRGWHTTG